MSYTGLTVAPLGHGAVIHPGTAALGGLILAYLVLGEPLTRARMIGVAAIILGLIVLAGEAITTIRGNALTGDLLFVTAGFMWAAFTTCLRGWRTGGMLGGASGRRAVAPDLRAAYALVFGFERMAAVGLARISCRSRAGRVRGLLALSICSPARSPRSAPDAPRCFRRWCRR